MSIQVEYEDKNLIVCRKRANIAVETANISQRDMVSELRKYMVETSGNSYIGVIHRLDQPVEGIVVFAKNKEAAADLSKQIAKRQFSKKYLARVTKAPIQEQGELVDYLIKDGKLNISKVVDKNQKGAKRSELAYKVLKEDQDGAIVEIDLRTGRHHQIRVQMANIGCPLWGDTKYSEQFQGKRGVNIALCAYKLEFENPATKEKMRFEVKPEHEMLNVRG